MILYCATIYGDIVGGRATPASHAAKVPTAPTNEVQQTIQPTVVPFSQNKTGDTTTSTEQQKFLKFVARKCQETDKFLVLDHVSKEFKETTKTPTSINIIKKWLRLYKENFNFSLSDFDKPSPSKIRQAYVLKAYIDPKLHESRHLIGYASKDKSLKLGVLDQSEDEEDVQTPMEHEPWFFDRISTQRANELLSHGPEGQFLVRFAESNGGASTITRRGKNQNNHFKVQDVDGQLRIRDERTFMNMNDLITYYTTNPILSSSERQLYLSDPLPK
ncbi:hypothetical protein CAEBREN_09233 [Caenorhabditis brenneri]|uniref:SH2 domain-containing protein n=1 Tax=Caenorhabditis brenneri TaxID=135651 RepID=G0NGF4_CAEBE|nr:hypothetical protein CAEBREN_09233 [Caenorhabditis brenneri]